MSTAVFGAPEWRARSGRTVKQREGGELVIGLLDGYLSPAAVMDMEEYFQAKRDAELGRWRDPVNPGCVVYATETDDVVKVFDEGSAVVTHVHRADALEWPIGAAWVIAGRYFEVHPVMKPWEDAEPGDAWVLTIGGEEFPAVVSDAYDFVTATDAFAFGSQDMHAVEDARLIYRADAS